MLRSIFIFVFCFIAGYLLVSVGLQLPSIGKGPIGRTVVQVAAVLIVVLCAAFVFRPAKADGETQ